MVPAESVLAQPQKFGAVQDNRGDIRPCNDATVQNAPQPEEELQDWEDNM